MKMNNIPNKSSLFVALALCSQASAQNYYVDVLRRFTDQSLNCLQGLSQCYLVIHKIDTKLQIE